MDTLLSHPVCLEEGACGERTFAAVYSDPVGGLWAFDVRGDGDGVYYCLRAADAAGSTTDPFRCLYTFEGLPVMDDIAGTEAAEAGWLAGGVADSARPLFARVRDGFLTVILRAGEEACLAVFKNTMGSSWGGPDGPHVIGEGTLPIELLAAAVAPLRLNEMSDRDGVSEVVSLALGCRAGDGCSEVALLRMTLVEDRVCLLDDNDEVNLRSLYRLKGDIAGMLFAESERMLVTVSTLGNIDVWDWDRQEDVTEAFGTLCYQPEVHGLPSGSAALALVRDRLWVGTQSGFLLVFDFHAGPHAHGCLTAPVHTLHANRGPVRQLLVMGLGTQLWSCAGGERVSVWGAELCHCVGVLDFPHGGLASLSRGPQQWCAPLYGVQSRSGRVSRFAVYQHVADGAVLVAAGAGAKHGGTRTSPTTAHPRGRALRCTPPREELEGHMLAVLRFASRQLEASQEEVPAAVEASLLALAAANDADPRLHLTGIGFLLDALDTLAKGRTLLERAVPARDGATFLTDLAAVVNVFEGAAARERSEAEFLDTLSQLLEAPAPLRTLSEAVDAVASLQRSPATVGGPPDRHPEVVTTPDSGAVTDEEEASSLRRQLLASQRLLEAREARIDQLEVALLTRDRAAEAARADATLTSRLESELHSARERVAKLEEELERLAEAADERDELRRAAVEDASYRASYEKKERLARRAIGAFLEVQGVIADEVGAVAEEARHCLTRDAHAASVPERERLTQLRDSVLALELLVTETLSDQKETFAALREGGM